jgi:hypothetical protein
VDFLTVRRTAFYRIDSQLPARTQHGRATIVVARALRWPAGIVMTLRPVVVVLIALLLAARAHADDIGDDLKPRIRTTEPRIRALIENGLERSPSLRALVTRLAAADVVVYLECGRLPPRLDGRLTFVSAAGGLRYVLVRLASDRPRARTIAALGHELQHAVEIAERPAIVDRTSLADEYSRFGFVREAADHARSFDTVAAIDAGRRIWRELLTRAED